MNTMSVHKFVGGWTRFLVTDTMTDPTSLRDSTEEQRKRVTFESYGSATQQLYVRSGRLATERRSMDSNWGDAPNTYWKRGSY